MGKSIAAALSWAEQQLKASCCISAYLDAQVLLAHVLQYSRAKLLAADDVILSQLDWTAYHALIVRRQQNEPVAYLCGEREFYSHAFAVNAHVLIPRPETETVIDCVLNFSQKQPPNYPWRILEVGTGSGILAVVLAHYLPGAQVVATDIAAKALAVAQANVERYGFNQRIQLVLADLWPAATAKNFDIVVSNPPYVAVDAKLPSDVIDYEPHQALFAGSQGLDVILRLLDKAPEVLCENGLLCFECGSEQSAVIMQNIKEQGCWATWQLMYDLAGLPRVIAANLQVINNQMS